MAEPLVIEQGTTRIIVVSKLRDARKQFLNPTGWTTHAVARTGVWGPVVAVWRSIPGAGEGQAEVVAADVLIDPTADVTEKWIYLHVTPAMSDAWTWGAAVLHIEIKEPGVDGREERFSVDLKLDPTTVRP